MSNQFNSHIEGWGSWGEIFCSIDAFSGLIEEIFKSNNLPMGKISNLTPGTNGVFKVGNNKVIKIFAPKESGIDSDYDFDVETKTMKTVSSYLSNTPKVIATGAIEDKYHFKYIIMEYINGKDAGDIFAGYSRSKKIIFANKIKEVTAIMNNISVNQISFDKKNLINDVNHNFRWKAFPENIFNQVKKFVSEYHYSNPVYVHGDLTGENVLIDEAGEIYIIDFADSKIAPKEYEYPPLVFELFQWDAEAVHTYFSDLSKNELIDALFAATLIHDFGGDFAIAICKKVLNIKPSELKDISQLKEALTKWFD